MSRQGVHLRKGNYFTARMQERGWVLWCIPVISAVEGAEARGSEVQGRLWLHRKFEANLDYTRPLSQKNLKKVVGFGHIHLEC